MTALMRACQPLLQQLRTQLRGTGACAGRLYATAEEAATTADPGQAADDDDPVMSAFHLQQSAYRQILEGLKNIDVPLAGDSAAIQKYADEVEALKKKAGYPDFEEIWQARIEQMMAEANSFSDFLSKAAESTDLGDMQPVMTDLIAAAEKAENQSGDDLSEENQEGWSMYQKGVEEIKAKHGLQDIPKIRRDAIYAAYEGHIQEMREVVTEVMENAKRRDQLEHVQIDLSAIKPRWDRM